MTQRDRAIHTMEDEIARLRAALEEISHVEFATGEHMREFALAALENRPVPA